MRFRLTLTQKGTQTIPINYQYPLSAWIYKVIQQADPEFSEWLHGHGYQFNGNRRYKLFTFSRLMLEKVKLKKELAQLEIIPGDHHLYLTFCMEEAAASFINGLFRKQHLIIADKYTTGFFIVSNVERLSDPDFSDGEVNFQCVSPLNVSKPNETSGTLTADYLHPSDSEFAPRLMENLVRRYATSQNRIAGMTKEGSYEASFLDLPFDKDEWEFNIKSRPRSRLQVIKAHTPQETKVRGYEFRFRLKAPPDLLRFGFAAGFGEKGSLGFGCVEVKD